MMVITNLIRISSKTGLADGFVIKTTLHKQNADTSRL